MPLADLCDRQLSPESAEIEVQLDMDDLLARFTAAGAGRGDAGRRHAAIGALALNTDTVAEPVRKAGDRGPWLRASRTGLTGPVLLPAIDALTGALTVFSRDSGVALVDAVAPTAPCPASGHRSRSTAAATSTAGGWGRPPTLSLAAITTAP